MILILITCVLAFVGMALGGVKGPTRRVGKNNFEVRTDGFGTMTDEEVAAYKAMRPRRYGAESIKDRITTIEARLSALEEPEPDPAPEVP